MFRGCVWLLVAFLRGCEAFDVFGYVRHFNVSDVAWEAVVPAVTHVIISSVDVSPRGHLALQNKVPQPDSALWSRIRGVADLHQSKVLVSIGGAGRGGATDSVIESPELREILVDQLLDFVESQNLDGIDFDVAIPLEPNRQENFSIFFEMLHDRLEEQDKILTLAVHPGPRQTIAESILMHADKVHLLAFDNWCAFPPTARPPCKHAERSFADEVIRQFLSVGHLQKKKTTLGIPFFGRHVTSGQMESYATWIRRHPHVKASDDLLGDMYINGRDTVRAKVNLALASGLGGVTLVDVGQDLAIDDKQSLLSAVDKTLEEATTRYQHDEEF